MKTLVAIIMGFFSGFLIYMMISMLIVDTGSRSTSSMPLVFLTFFGGWAFSSWLLLREARSVSKVFSRGFLLGAAEWLAMAFVGLIFSGRAVSTSVESGTGSGAETAGAVIGGGLVAALAGGISVFMAVVCLIGFAVSYFIGKEMRDRTSLPTRKCPECAEMIQAEARKCRYCGASLVTENTLPAPGTEI